MLADPADRHAGRLGVLGSIDRPRETSVLRPHRERHI
jgi:hypothetical protein